MASAEDGAIGKEFLLTVKLESLAVMDKWLEQRWEIYGAILMATQTLN